MTAAYLYTLASSPNILESYRCACKGVLSSKAAEFTARIMGLCSIPSTATKISIYSDSQTAINFINHFIQNTRSYDSIYFAYSDDEILERTLYFELAKRRNHLEMIKVKSHSGIHLNETVDKLPEEGHGRKDARRLTKPVLGNLRMTYRGPLQLPIRRLVETCQAVARATLTKIILLETFRQLPLEDKMMITKSLRSILRGQYFKTCFSSNRVTAFFTKYIFNQLSLMNKQYAWYTIYGNNHCKRCSAATKESKQHMLECAANTTDMHTIMHSAMDKIPKLHIAQKENLLQILEKHQEFIETMIPSTALIQDLRTLLNNNLSVQRTVKHLCNNIMNLLYVYI
jgi:ribonuclease HI